MSNQLQATGAVKVRSLTGVLVGTSGVVSSLNIDGSLGIPQLDVNGKILVSQLPNSVMEYKGTWNASTNTPTLVNGTGNQGDVYLCNVAGTVNFGAGAIAFFVGDQVIYSGSIWQRASGATGTVTSVAVTETGDSLNITGSPITTSGTINIGFNGTNLQYINGAGNLTTFPALTGYVPYTGATQDVDLGAFNLTADVITGATGSFTSNGGSNTFSINHSSGAGIALNITKGGSGEGLYINKTSGSGNAASIVGTLEATTLVKTGGTSSQFLKADGSVDSSGYVTGSGSDGRVAFWTGASTLSSDANLYYDYSTDRLGIGTNTPNASLGILNASTTGIQVRTSDSANQYQANIFYDASYGMVYGYNRLGTGTASNLTFFNNIGGFLSIPESSNNNIGFNTINPQGSSATTVYDFTSTSTNVEIRLHNPTTGYTSTDGSYIKVTPTALVIGNDESSKSILVNNGGFGVVTIDGTNKVALGDIGVIPMTQQLTVVGSIQAYGGSIYQTVTSSMLKANASGQIIAAVGGTDYEYPLTFSSPLVRTTNTISIPAATTSVNGYLTSTDWNTFNNKGSGTVTSVTGTAPVVSSGGTTPAISMAAATTSVSGYLTSTDWTTFNNKFTLPSLTQGSILFSDGTTIAQNNNRLFWNNSTMRLGVGSQPVAQYVMYVKANIGENANAWLGIDNDNATGSTALRLILNGGTTSGFQYVQSTNMTQVFANAGDIQLINGSSLGLTIANTTGTATFSSSVIGQSFATNTVGYYARFEYAGGTKLTQNAPDTETSDSMTFVINGGATTTTGNAFIFKTQTGNTTPATVLTILKTGAATFSSNINLSNGALTLNRTNGNAQLYFQNNGASDWDLGTQVGDLTQNFALYNRGTSTQSFYINKSTNGAFFNGTITASNLSGTNTGDQTLAGLGGLPLTGGTLTGNLYMQSSGNPSQLLAKGTNTEFWVDSQYGGGTARAFINRNTTGNQATLMFTTGIAVTNGTAWAGSVDWSMGMVNDSTNNFYIGYGDIFSSSNRAITITSSRNVGIGTSLPRAKLDVSDGTDNTSGEAIFQGLFTGASRPSTSDLTSILTIQSNDAMAADKGGSIAFGGRAVSSSSGGANWAGISGLKENGTSANYSGYLQFWTRGGSPTEKMRITSGGNALIGTTSDSGRKLQVVGTSTPLFLNKTNNVSGSYCNIWALGGSNTDNTSSYYLFCDTDFVGVKMVIYGNGNLANVNNSYGAYSDIKLKENIVDATPKLDDLLKVKIRSFNLKGSDIKQIGVIAQELEEIFPSMIEESNDTIKDGNAKYIENGEKTKAVKYSVFVPILIKAMQEQQAIITSLQEQINELKNK